MSTYLVGIKPKNELGEYVNIKTKTWERMKVFFAYHDNSFVKKYLNQKEYSEEISIKIKSFIEQKIPSSMYCIGFAGMPLNYYIDSELQIQILRFYILLCNSQGFELNKKRG